MATKFWLSYLGSTTKRNKLIRNKFKSDTVGLYCQSKGLEILVISNPSDKGRDVVASPQVQQRDFLVHTRELSRAAISHDDKGGPICIGDLCVMMWLGGLLVLPEVEH